MFADRVGHVASPRSPTTFGQLVALLTAIEALAICGMKAEAGALYPAVVEAMRAGNVLRVWDSRLLSSVAGLAAACAGLLDEAMDHFRSAVRLADELPHRIEQAEARRLFATVLLDQGEPGDADLANRLLEEAMAGYHAVGMPRHEAMARELLARAEPGRR